jgi:hypothetical protein
MKKSLVIPCRLGILIETTKSFSMSINSIVRLQRRISKDWETQGWGKVDVHVIPIYGTKRPSNKNKPAVRHGEKDKE